MHIKNARLKKIHFKDENGNYMWGFKLMAKGNTLGFYTQEEQKSKTWIEALKQSVVLLDLKEAFKISKLLGRGNFARVHLCNRIGDDDKFFALKTMEKASIKKCRRNIVSFDF